MTENFVISNPPRFEKLKKEFQRGGADRLHVLSDFDRTLTYAFVDGEKVPSLISILRSSGKYLGEDYAMAARALYKKYHPIETDSKISIQEKKKAMKEWWTTHFDLIIKSGLNKKHLKIVVESGKMKLREGTKKFFDLLHKYKIPLIIMSSSGLGGDVISMFLEKENKLYSNIYIISNSFVWDKNGNAIDFKKPIIHCMNKDETVLKNFPFCEVIKNRKNVLLLGDNPEDVGMVEGFDYDGLIKVGFLNEDAEENLDSYKKVFDALILNDSSISCVNDLLKEIMRS